MQSVNSSGGSAGNDRSCGAVPVTVISGLLVDDGWVALSVGGLDGD